MKSRRHSSRQSCLVITALISHLILQGCSSFSTMEEGGDDALFRASTPDRPIPAEIAQDLTSLNREGFRQLQAEYAARAASEAAIAAARKDPAYASSPQVAQGTPPTAPMAPLGAGVSSAPLVAASPSPGLALAASEPGANKVQVNEDPVASTNTSEKSSRKPAAVHVASKGKKGSASGGPYVVKRGDTLMKIAFETFGDLERWKELYNSNKSKIGSYNVLRAGMVLNLPDREFVLIERNGSPYLIKRRDTLGKISHSLYGTESKWRLIWHNNPQLIHDPNKIYAGFTLYYQPQEFEKNEIANSTRTPASQPVAPPVVAPAAVAQVPVLAPVAQPAAAPAVAPAAPQAPANTSANSGNSAGFQPVAAPTGRADDHP